MSVASVGESLVFECGIIVVNLPESVGGATKQIASRFGAERDGRYDTQLTVH